MRSVIASLAAVLLSLSPSLNANSGAEPLEEGDAVERYIVQFAGDPVLAEADAVHVTTTAREQSSELRRDQRVVIEQAELNGSDIEIITHLTASYNGVVADLSSEQKSTLEGMDKVVAVYPDIQYRMDTDVSVPHIGADQVWQRTDPNGEVLDGTGQIIAILDTGVDYNHPDLGGGFGPNAKVVGGYDFVNNDEDPMDDNGHGTHVAGIAAGTGRQAVTGVAPGAQLTAYKVLDRWGNGDLSSILAALDHAVAPENPHRADVVNMSLSAPLTGSDPLGEAAAEAVQAGVVVVASAGNSGPGPRTVRSPGSTPEVLTVGASATGVHLPDLRLTVPVQEAVASQLLTFSAPLEGETIEAHVVHLGDVDPRETRDDLSGAAVVMIHGPNNETRALAALEAGAELVLFYVQDFWPGQSGGGGMGPGADNGVAVRVGPFQDDLAPGIVVLQIPGSSGDRLRMLAAQGRTTLQLRSEDMTDAMAMFSSRGPSSTFGVKPDVVAPGVDIMSTLPDEQFGRSSGTSMSSPHVAGAVALLRQAHPDWTADLTHSALVASSGLLPDVSPLTQGSGLIDVEKAVDTRLVASPPRADLGLTDSIGAPSSVMAEVTLFSLDGERKDAALTVQPWQGDAQVTVPEQVTIDPGGTTIQVTATVPDASQAQDVTGWIAVDIGGDSGTDLHVPYGAFSRPLQVRATPDPVQVGKMTTINVTTPVPVIDPVVTANCQGSGDVQVPLTQVGDLMWSGDLTVGREGVCELLAQASAPRPDGQAILGGRADLEVIPVVGDNQGQAFWQPVGPLHGGGPMAFDPSRNGREMMTITRTVPSVHVSSDRGQTWTQRFTLPVAGGDPVAVQAHPTVSRTAYIAVNGGFYDPAYQGRIYVTRNWGESWTALPGPDRELRTISLSDDGRHLAAADATGTVRVSSDEGVTWTQITGNISLLRDMAWRGSDLYLASNGGLQVLRATHDGWSTPVTLLRPGVLGWAGRVAVDGDAVFTTSYPSATIYRSTDGGETFTQVLNAGSGSFNDLQVSGESVMAANTGGLWVSTDGGGSFSNWGTPVDGTVMGYLGSWPSPHPSVRGAVYVFASGAGLHVATGPDQFNRIGPAGITVQALEVSQIDGQDALVAGTFRDTKYTTVARRASIRPEDLEWDGTGDARRNVDVQHMATHPSDSSVVYKTMKTGALGYEVLVSEDGGREWETLVIANQDPYALHVHPAAPERIYVANLSATEADILTSFDGGMSWERIYTGQLFTSFAGDPVDPDRLWAGNENGLFLSQDGGRSFNHVNDHEVRALAVSPMDPEHIIIAGRFISASLDGGMSFAVAEQPMIDLWATDVEFNPADPNKVYVAGSSFFDEVGVLKGGRGVLHSTDGGLSWQPLNDGLQNRMINALAVSHDGRTLYAGTYEGSVHRLQAP